MHLGELHQVSLALALGNETTKNKSIDLCMAPQKVSK
jgi:hypothetical protein